MIIREDTIQRRYSKLDSIPLLEEGGVYTDNRLIPIIESDGQLFINLNSILEYAHSVSILDYGLALSAICEAQSVNPDDLGFIIYEEDFLESTYIQELATELYNHNIPILLENTLETKAVVDECLDFLDEKVHFMHGDLVDTDEGNRTKLDQFNKDISDNYTKTFDITDEREFAAHKRAQADVMDMFRDRTTFQRQQMVSPNQDNLVYKHKGDLIDPIGDTSGNAEAIRKGVKKLNDPNFMNEKDKNGNTNSMTKRILKALIKLADPAMRYQSEGFDDLSKHIMREEMPRNVIARLIAKLRRLYNGIMIKYKTGISQANDQQELKEKIAKFDNKEHKSFGDKLKIAGHTMWALSKNMLKTIAGKILWLIDRLLQKLQNASSKYLWKDNLLSKSSSTDDKKS